jgi:hypothetical protein
MKIGKQLLIKRMIEQASTYANHSTSLEVNVIAGMKAQKTPSPNFNPSLIKNR